LARTPLEFCRMSDTRTVLVIDDDPGIREALQIALEDRGYRVICAPDGDAGIRRAVDDRPDLVIVDMMMPRTSGFVVLDRLKHHHRMQMPIIMLTGIASDHQRAYAEMLGVDDFLHKPVYPDQFFRSVGDLCPLPDAEPAAPTP
jgi:DNA-binding response OmpR family regulator